MYSLRKACASHTPLLYNVVDNMNTLSPKQCNSSTKPSSGFDTFYVKKHNWFHKIICGSIVWMGFGCTIWEKNSCLGIDKESLGSTLKDVQLSRIQVLWLRMAPLFKEGDIMYTLTWVHICFMTNLSYPHHFSKRCISIDCQHLRDTKNDLQDIEVEIRFSQFYVCFGSLNFMCVR